MLLRSIDQPDFQDARFPFPSIFLPRIRFDSSSQNSRTEIDEKIEKTWKDVAKWYASLVNRTHLEVSRACFEENDFSQTLTADAIAGTDISSHFHDGAACTAVYPVDVTRKRVARTLMKRYTSEQLPSHHYDSFTFFIST